MADRVSPLLPPSAVPRRTREQEAEELRYRISIIVRDMTDIADLYAVLFVAQDRERKRKGAA